MKKKASQPAAEPAAPKEQPKDQFYALHEKQLEALINFFLDNTATRVGSQYVAFLKGLPTINVKAEDASTKDN